MYTVQGIDVEGTNDARRTNIEMAKNSNEMQRIAYVSAQTTGQRLEKVVNETSYRARFSVNITNDWSTRWYVFWARSLCEASIKS